VLTNITLSSKLLANLVLLPHSSQIPLTTNQQPQSHPDVPHPRPHPPTNHSSLPSLCQPSPVLRLTSRLNSPGVTPRVKNSFRNAKSSFDSPIRPLPMDRRLHSFLRTSKVLPPPPGSDNIVLREKTPPTLTPTSKRNSSKLSETPIRLQTLSLASNISTKENNHWNNILPHSLSSRPKPTSLRKAISSVDSSLD